MQCAATLSMKSNSYSSIDYGTKGLKAVFSREFLDRYINMIVKLSSCN